MLSHDTREVLGSPEISLLLKVSTMQHSQSTQNGLALPCCLIAQLPKQLHGQLLFFRSVKSKKRIL